MARTQQDFRDAVYLEIGNDLEGLIEDADVDRWVNLAKDQLGARVGSQIVLSWIANDQSVALPADFEDLSHIRPRPDVRLPAYRIHGGKLWFDDPSGAFEAGSADLFYWTLYPDVTETEASAMRPNEERACISYCLYRFFRRLATSRADYRRYSTITGQNGVDIQELRVLSDEYRLDFEDAARETLKPEPASYYGD